MMTPQEIKEGLTFPCGRWEAEPLLGSIYGQEELDAVTEAIKASMDFRNGFGFSSEPIFAFEKAMADYVGVRYAIAVNSCGPGMDIVMRSLHLQPGEEVIVPSINYDAAPLCVLGAGGNVVWGESRAEDYMLDPADVERKITPNTRAILAVSIHGLTPPMDEYLAIAAENGIDWNSLDDEWLEAIVSGDVSDLLWQRQRRQRRTGRAKNENRL